MALTSDPLITQVTLLLQQHRVGCHHDHSSASKRWQSYCASPAKWLQMLITELPPCSIFNLMCNFEEWPSELDMTRLHERKHHRETGRVRLFGRGDAGHLRRNA